MGIRKVAQISMVVVSSEGIATTRKSWQADAVESAASSSHARLKVFLVEDHLMFRTQLARAILKDSRLTVCGESDNGRQALEMIESTQPDLIIVDVTLKGSSGLELVKDLKSRDFHAPVLVLSMHDESMYAERALKAGASGYVTKHQVATQLKSAIDCVLGGGVFFSPRMTTQMLRTALSHSEHETRSEGAGSLTAREAEIFRLIGKGYSTKDIAQELQLGEKTVHSHRFQIKAKLGIKHTAELYNQAIRWAEDQASPKSGWDCPRDDDAAK